MSSTLDLDTLQRYSDENLAELVRHVARSGEHTTISEREGLLLVSGSHAQPGPYRNVALRLTDELPAAEAIARAEAFFVERQRSFVFWVRMHADQDIDELAAWEPLEPEGLPQYAALEPFDEPAPAFGVQVVSPVTDELRRDFLMVNADGWGLDGMPYELARQMLFEPSMLDAPNVIAVMAYLTAEPAATCMTIATPGCAGGYWGATARFARRQGLWRLLVTRAFNRSFERGARVVVCQASRMNEANTLRLGFREVSRYKRYLVTAA
jgi:GNAT superfamily N-acetyltransferase